MCAGKAYDDKSDIWALGCIVYEMACLQKTFEGSNLPALVNKVLSTQKEDQSLITESKFLKKNLNCISKFSLTHINFWASSPWDPNEIPQDNCGNGALAARI